MVTTIEVPRSHIADVITYLEMNQKPDIEIPDSSLTIEPWSDPDPKAYLELFRAVGEPWLWLSRLLLNQAELSAILEDTAVELFLIKEGDENVGFIELDFREPGECELGFIGLIKRLNGQGHGQWLMAETLKRAWRDDINRVWLHTCTLDSPFALGYYLKCGFTAYKREVSMNDDPRLNGLLPKSAGLHIPIIS